MSPGPCCASSGSQPLRWWPWYRKDMQENEQIKDWARVAGLKELACGASSGSRHPMLDTMTGSRSYRTEMNLCILPSLLLYWWLLLRSWLLECWFLLVTQCFPTVFHSQGLQTPLSVQGAHVKKTKSRTAKPTASLHGKCINTIVRPVRPNDMWVLWVPSQWPNGIPPVSPCSSWATAQAAAPCCTKVMERENHMGFGVSPAEMIRDLPFKICCLLKNFQEKVKG